MGYVKKGSPPRPPDIGTGPDDRAGAMQVWAKGACTGGDVEPDVFFPVTSRLHDIQAPLKVCAECPVRTLCGDVFGPTVPFGTLGGMTEDERRRTRRTR